MEQKKEWNRMKSLKIGDFVARLPIIQGGMGIGVSLSGLASAVANQGGIGVIAVPGIGMLESDFRTNYMEANIRALRREISKARALTKGILGVNIMVALTNFSDMVRTAVEEKIDIIFAGAGLPLNLPLLVENSKTRIVPIVSSARAAVLIARRWIEKYNYIPDAFVVEGPMAGGHLGFKPEQIDDPAFSLEKILIEVVAEMKKFKLKYKKTIPVIAGGGIFTGGDIRRMIGLGASGVQMATRFVTTEECDASPAFKKAYLDCREEDIEIIKSPVGLPGRAIRNRFIEDVDSGVKKKYNCPYHCISTCNSETSPYCIMMALMSAQKGDMCHGFAFCGTNAYRSDKIISVKELTDTLILEYNSL
jgi:NAD(P)H-dependent flavin oxidoreductase YrpB (nitropropane dioxygenase family)